MTKKKRRTTPSSEPSKESKSKRRRHPFDMDVHRYVPPDIGDWRDSKALQDFLEWQKRN